MAALIRGCHHISKKELDEMSEDDFFESWGQTKYYLEVVHQVEFK